MRNISVLVCLISFAYLLLNPHQLFAKGFTDTIEEKKQQKFNENNTVQSSVSNVQQEKFDKKKEPDESSIAKEYDIQFMTKNRIKGKYWSYEDASGFSNKGNAPVYSIDVRFRLNKDTKEAQLTKCAVYLYDKDKNLVEKLQRCFVFLSSVAQEDHTGGAYSFRCKKTYLLQFIYDPKRVNFKYFLFVIGDDTEVAVDVKPFASYEDFEFDEKTLVK